MTEAARHMSRKAGGRGPTRAQPGWHSVPHWPEPKGIHTERARSLLVLRRQVP